MGILNIALEEIKRLEQIIIELNDQIQVEKNINQQAINNNSCILHNILEEPRLPMYRGDENRYDEIIKALEDAGGVNSFNNKGHRSECYYYIGESNIIRFTDYKDVKWLLEQLFELKELPPKKIKLIEGEFYKCKGAPNDRSIFIYKNVNEYDTSYLCGIDRGGDFTRDIYKYFGSLYNIIPATQEQKEILLKRIDDEGYIYNKEKATLVKKKEKVEFTLSVENYDRIVCRDYDSQKWLCCIFGDEIWNQTLPFNEETKKLIGTTDAPDKEYILIS